MPTYEYKCNACEHTFEAFQSITEEPVKLCPACGKERVQRLISAGAGLLFKGSGFYITDYRSDSYRRDAKKDSETTKPKPKTESKAASPSGGSKT